MNLYNDDTLKFSYDGEQYLLHIREDSDPLNPRKDCYNAAIMACFHPRYNLGDDISAVGDEELWISLVAECFTDEELIKRAESGAIRSIRLSPCDDPDMVSLSVCYKWATVLGDSDSVWGEMKVDKRYLAHEIRESLSIKACQALLKGKVEWLPLYLYDHSGITMSTSPFCDPWDSGMVGWIYCTKEHAVDDIGWNEDTWAEQAIKAMEEEVKVYDQYLTGDVYGFTLLRLVDGEWEEEDSCWGFFGSDIETNGITDYMCGLEEAIRSGEYEYGEAKLVTMSFYKYS